MGQEGGRKAGEEKVTKRRSRVPISISPASAATLPGLEAGEQQARGATDATVLETEDARR